MSSKKKYIRGRRQLYRHVFEKYGARRQMRKLQEACAELVVAINHYVEFSCLETSDDLVEGLADVEIMCEQVRLFVGGDSIDDVKTGKLLRLRDRINSLYSL